LVDAESFPMHWIASRPNFYSKVGCKVLKLRGPNVGAVDVGAFVPWVAQHKGHLILERTSIFSDETGSTWDLLDMLASGLISWLQRRILKFSNIQHTSDTSRNLWSHFQSVNPSNSSLF
jgi:hypothetical protein